VLTPLQEQVASIVAGLAEAEGFALAGGAALIARGEIQRETRDLDFFGLTPDDVDRLVRQHPAPTLSGEELAVDKVLVVFEMFAEMAGRFSRLRAEEFGLDRQRYEQLERKVLEWQERARDR
jgi:hypothetical protein